MTYPLAPLGVRIRAAIGVFDRSADPSTWPWTDITLDVDHLVPVNDSIGAPDDDSQTNTTLSFALKNDTSRIATTVFARYTCDNAESDLYPFFDVGCPIEYALDVGDGGGYDIQCIAYLQSSTNEWPGNTQYKSVAKIQCVGLLQIGGVLTQPQHSPMYRTIMDRRNLGFWPLEDASGSKTGASAIPTQPPLTPYGSWAAVEFGSAALVPGVASGVKISTGQAMIVKLNQPSSGAGIRVGFLLFAETNPGAQGELISFTNTAGWRFALEIGPSNLRFRAYNNLSVEVSGAASIGFTTHLQTPVFCELDVTQSGGTITWTIREIAWFINAAGAAAGTTVFSTNTFSGALGTVNQVLIAAFGNVNDVWISALAMTEQPFPTSGGFAAVLGWAGNTAAARVAGMCGEAGLPYSVTSTAYGAPMGAQLIDTVRANMLDVQSTDHGVLSDHLGKVSYRALQELYNLVSAMVLTRTIRGQLGELTPVRDDTAKVNRITLRRHLGGSTVAEDTQDIALKGLYESAPSSDLNVSLDAALIPQAGWYLARGTSTDYRYSELVMRMRVAAEFTPALAGAAASLQLGDTIGVLSLPPQAGKNGFTRQVRGRTQTVLNRGMKQWDITYAMVSTDAYRAFVLDGDRMDTSGTEVILAATTTDTTIMAMTAGALPEVGTGFSILLDASGEQVILTGAATETIVDTYTRTVSNGWGSIPATAHLPAYAYSPSVLASDYAATGSAATMLLSAANSARTMFLQGMTMINPDFTIFGTVPVLATGANIELQVGYRWILSAADNYAWRIAIEPAGTTRLIAFIPGTTNTVVDVPLGITHTAGATYGIRVAPIGTTHRCKVWQGSTSANEPANWAVQFEDSTRLTGGSPLIRAGRQSGNTNAALTITWDNLTFNNVQALTMTRSVNSGIVKTQPVGSRIRLWQGRGLGI